MNRFLLLLRIYLILGTIFTAWLTFTISLHVLRSSHVLTSRVPIRAIRPRPEEWLAFLRIQRTGSSFLSVGLASYPNNFGGGCGWSDCRCQHAMPPGASRFHAGSIPCSQMTCVETCKRAGKRSLTLDPSHADYSELEMGFARERIPLTDVRMFTILRKPVERILSEYRKVKKDCCQGGIDRLLAWDYVLEGCNISLSEFIESDAVKRMGHNRQTKMIAGVGDFRWEDMYQTEDDMLKMAMTHLDDMSFLLIHERMQESLKLLHACSGFLGTIFSGVAQEPKNPTNSTDSDTQLTPELNRRIFELNTLDQQLYFYAVKRFNELMEDVQMTLCPIREHPLSKGSYQG